MTIKCNTINFCRIIGTKIIPISIWNQAISFFELNFLMRSLRPRNLLPCSSCATFYFAFPSPFANLISLCLLCSPIYAPICKSIWSTFVWLKLCPLYSVLWTIQKCVCFSRLWSWLCIQLQEKCNSRSRGENSKGCLNRI